MRLEVGPFRHPKACDSSVWHACLSASRVWPLLSLALPVLGGLPRRRLGSPLHLLRLVAACWTMTPRVWAVVA